MPLMGSRRGKPVTTLAGVWNRKQFSVSISVLRSLGLSPQAIKHYRRLGRATRRLPHELVLEVAEEAAAHPNEAIRSLLYFHIGPRTGGI
jgi:EAL domain-containing protein (putative c-di-GMP-specific phosphodiesterase class I)